MRLTLSGHSEASEGDNQRTPDEQKPSKAEEAHATSWHTGDGLHLRLAAALLQLCRQHRDPNPDPDPDPNPIPIPNPNPNPNP